jgi:chromosome segregation ATPase
MDEYEKQLKLAIEQCYDKINTQKADIKEFEHQTNLLEVEVESIVNIMRFIRTEAVLKVLREAIVNKTAELDQRNQDVESMRHTLNNFNSQLEFVQNNICPHLEKVPHFHDQDANYTVHMCVVCGLIK